MDILSIEGTESTPEIVMDKTNSVFKIVGKSLPEKAEEFYRPVIAWMDQYTVHPNASTCLEIRLEYLNTGTSKFLLNLFLKLQKINGARIEWYFPEDDEDMEETGEDFAEVVSIPFELKPY